MSISATGEMLYVQYSLLVTERQGRVLNRDGEGSRGEWEAICYTREMRPFTCRLVGSAIHPSMKLPDQGPDDARYAGEGTRGMHRRSGCPSVE